MVVRRGEIWWASLPAPIGSSPGFSRPVLILQSDVFNRSPLNTVVVAAMTSNMRRALAPGNVACAPAETGLPRDSVVNVTQLLTLDKSLLCEQIGALPAELLRQVECGVRMLLALG